MYDMEAIRRRLAGFLGNGPIMRDGAEVGFWHVTDHNGVTPRKVDRLWRDRDGTMLGDVARCPEGSEGEVAGHGTREGFGYALSRLVRTAFPLDGMRDVVCPPVTGAAMSELLRMHPGMDYVEAQDLGARVGRESLVPGAGRFLSTLDAAAVRLVGLHPTHAAALGEWWGDIDGSAGDAPLARALATHPGFPAQVLAVHAEEGPGGMRRLLAAGTLGDRVAARLVADGVPRSLVPAAARAEAALSALAAEAAVRPDAAPATLRRMLTSGGRQPWPVELCLHLVGLPGAWVPRDAAAWRAYAPAAWIVRNVAFLVDREALARVLNAGDGWDAFMRRLAAAAGTGDAERLSAALNDADDMVGAYAAEALAPVRGPREAGPGDDGYDDDLRCRARSVLFGGRSLAKVLALSADWHRRQHGMRAAVAAMPGAYVDTSAWAPGLPDASYGDVAVTVLRDVPSLVAAASDLPDADGVPGLDNCAGTYGPECRDGGTRILELRRRLPGGRAERLSMAEIDVSQAPALRVAQHVGRGNGAAPPEAKGILQAYVADVASGRLAVDPDAFDPVPDDGSDPFVRHCGFDPAAEGTRLAVAGLWNRYLPRPWRGVDPAVLLAMPPPDGHGWGAVAPSPPPGTASPRP